MRFDAAFYRSLASMYRAGLDWGQALDSVDDGRQTLRAARDRVRNGHGISAALAPHLDPLARALLHAGEASGQLEQTLTELADEAEQRERTRKELQGATLYPLFLAHLGALLIAVPELIDGRVGMALLWALILLLPTWGLRLWMSRLLSPAQPGEHAARPRAPRLRVGPFLAGIEMADARGLTALAACHDAGLTLTETLEHATQAATGGRAAVDLHAARVLVAQGHPIGPAFQHLPRRIAQALVIAEQTGDLSTAAREGANSLRFDASLRLKRFKAVFPVLVFLLVAAVFAARIFDFYGSYADKVRSYR